MLTYQDCVEHLVDWNGGNAGDHTLRELRRAIKSAISEIAAVRQWRYLNRIASVNLNAQYNTGTIAYDATGGTYERQVTLTTGTWPSWAANGVLRVTYNSATCDFPIDRRISSSIVTLVSDPAPADDIASGTSYTLYQDAYTLPVDFLAIGQVYPNQTTAHVWGQQDQHAARRLGGSSGLANSYTIRQDRKTPGRSAIYLDGWPTAAGTVEFQIRCLPRALVYSGYQARDRQGKVSISGQAVTGDGTAFESGMVGSVFRASVNSTAFPSSEVGDNPFASQSVIQSVESATSLTLRDSVTTATSVKYTISDPIGIASYMETLFFRCCEKQAEIVRQRDTSSLSNTLALYNDELYRVMALDSKMSFEPRPLGGYIVSRNELERNQACGSDVLFP